MIPKGEEGGEASADDARGKLLPDLIELASVVDPQLAVVIKNPRRVQLLAIAHERDISPSEFAKEADITLKESIGHFEALTGAGFMELAEEVKERGAVKHMYRATKRAYFSVIDWGKLGKTVQSGMGEAVLADLNGRVTDALSSGTFQAHSDAVLYWLGLTLDEESWPEFVKILSWTIKEVQELGVETVSRRANGEQKGQTFPVTFGIAGFESPPSGRREKQNEEFQVSPEKRGGEQR